MTNQHRLTFSKRGNWESYPSRIGSRLARFKQWAGCGPDIKGLLAWIKSGDLCQGCVKVLGHGLGTTVEDCIQRIAACQCQAYFRAESSKPGLLEGGQRGGALALDRVANASFERMRLELSLHEVIGRSRLHCLYIDLMFART